MAGPEGAQRRLLLGAQRGGRGAPGAEAAARRRRRGRGQLAADGGDRGDPAGGRLGDRVDERPGVVVGGRAEQLGGRPGLDDLAQVHHRDVVGQVVDHRQVVRHHQVAELVLGLERGHQVEDLGPDRHVQRRHGLVGHDQRRAGGQGAGQADALALPAGQLARVPVELAHGQPGLLGQLPDLAAALLAGQAALGPQRLLDDAGQRHPRVERGVRVLEHHLHVVAGRAALRPAHRAQRGAAQPHLALGGLLQPDDHPAQGGLAAARLAHDAQRAARGDLQADARHRLDRRGRPGQQAAGPVVLGHVDQAEQRGGGLAEGFAVIGAPP